MECAELERCGLKWRGVLSSGGAHELQGGMNWRGVAKGGGEWTSSHRLALRVKGRQRQTNGVIPDVG